MYISSNSKSLIVIKDMHQYACYAGFWQSQFLMYYVMFLWEQKCGLVVNWKRVQGAKGKLQGKHIFTVTGLQKEEIRCQVIVILDHVEYNSGSAKPIWIDSTSKISLLFDVRSNYKLII